jgi:selenocysteine lyase/cysteine desulfurase
MPLSHVYGALMLDAMTSVVLQSAIDSFTEPRLFLAAASIGLPTRETIAALRNDLDLWSASNRDPMDYEPIIARTRGHYARLVNVPVANVAIASQTSVMASVFASAVPAGGEVLVVDGDFSSIVFPFLQRPGITVRSVPLSSIADEVTDATWLVAFSLVQSSNGRVAPVSAILEAAAAHGALTLCDTTQGAGVHPVDASLFDATVCHAYKWLCSPRGVGFMTLSPAMQQLLVPIHAGWFAGDEIWQSCYGPAMNLATDARRFDVSPAWPTWVGAEPAIRMFAGLDVAEVWSRTSGLGDLLCDGLGIPQQHQAIVTWADDSGRDLGLLSAAGIKASGRAGRVRASFHLWNDESDVAAVVAALR